MLGHSERVDPIKPAPTELVGSKSGASHDWQNPACGQLGASPLRADSRGGVFAFVNSGKNEQSAYRRYRSNRQNKPRNGCDCSDPSQASGHSLYAGVNN